MSFNLRDVADGGFESGAGDDMIFAARLYAHGRQVRSRITPVLCEMCAARLGAWAAGSFVLALHGPTLWDVHFPTREMDHELTRFRLGCCEIKRSITEEQVNYQYHFITVRCININAIEYPSRIN
jgi:hypothetical protein